MQDRGTFWGAAPNGAFAQSACGAVCALLIVFLRPGEASSQAIATSDLEGLVIEANVVRAQTVRRQVGAFHVTMHQNWRIALAANERLELKVETTSYGPKGERTAQPTIGHFKLNQLREVRSRGGGHAMWTFADNRLTFMRTFRSGALRMHFDVMPGLSGLSCTVTGGFAREVGKEAVTLESPFGGEVTILNAKNISSDCKVVRSS